MQNIGEEIAGQYLKVCRDCEFVEYNLKTENDGDIDVGEIDVIGINVNKDQPELYICEVAIHLVTGLLYVRNGVNDNYERLTHKFSNDIKYAKKYFPNHKKFVMLWSPIVKSSKEGSKLNELDDVERVKKFVIENYGRDIESFELIINTKYQKALDELRDYASKETKEINSPVLRYMQIEELLKKHLKKTSPN